MKMNVYVFVYKNVSVSWGLYVLTQFQQMFVLCKNQVVDFYLQNVWKTPVEEWHFKKRCRSTTCIFT